MNKKKVLEGDGVLTSVINLSYEAIKHILPGLLNKGGEEVGSRIGKLLSDKIYTEHGDQIGKGILTDEHNKKNTKKKFPSSSSHTSQNIIITPQKTSSQNGEGFILAGDTNNEMTKVKKGKTVKYSITGVVQKEEQEGKGKKKIKVKGHELAGKGYELAGKGYELAGKSEQKGNGLMKMIQNGNGLNKKITNGLYTTIYNNVCDLMGKNTTNTTQIDEFGKHIFKTKWGGCIPSDYAEKLDMSKNYVINYDTSDEKGSHWTGCTNYLLFDSLSLEETQVDNIFKKYKLKYINNKNILQNYSDNTCGQHALTFLILYSKFGNSILKYL